MKILIDGQTLETGEINRGIGRYFKSIVNNMLKMDFVNEWFITVSDEKYLSAFEPWVKQKLKVIERDSFSPNNIARIGWKTNEQYSKDLNDVIKKYGIDSYWNANPMMVNVMFPIDKLEAKIYVTFYDLIPYIFKSHVLDTWGQETIQEYQRRLNYINSLECTVLFISEHSKKDFDKYVGNKYENCIVTHLGAEAKLFYKPYNVPKTKNEFKIIMVGGCDFRKNMYKAITAFAKAKNKYNNSIINQSKLYIVCSMNEEEKDKFRKFVKKSNVENDVVITGFISDEELSHLYNTSSLFFFPSLYEGFGLPVLEALLAGCYALIGNNSSLPEVGQQYADYCDVDDVDQMSSQLFESLVKASEEDESSKIARKNYALKFSWEKTANIILNHITANISKQEKKKHKIAVVTPWPPQKSGIANFTSKLVMDLKEFFDIDVYVDDSKIALSKYVKFEGIKLFSISNLYKTKDNYDQIIYHLGNNSEYHTTIYQTALEIPGIVEIHDYVLHPFMYHSFYLPGNDSYYREALEYYGKKGAEHYKAVKAKLTDPDIYQFPMVEYICSKSNCTIVHSRWVANNLSNIHNVYVIPLPSFESNVEEKCVEEINFKKKYAIGSHEFIVGCMGFVNKNKRPDVVLEAISKLKNEGYPIKLMFFGEAGEYNKELLNMIKEKNLDSNVVITGYLNETEYASGLMYSDVIVNLRYPSMGESSGTLCEAFKHKKPVIVSNVNQYKEFPDEVCWKVDIGKEEIHQLVGYLKYLLKNKDVRRAMGNNAYEYCNAVLNVKSRISKQFVDLINELSSI